MKANGNEVRAGQSWPVRSLALLAFFAAATISAAHGQTLMGSPGAGWQTWSVTPNSSIQANLNDNGSPYWDVLWASALGGYSNPSPADRNAGFCMTSTGDCIGLGSGALAPGAIPFWGMPYDSVNDTNGARDNTMYFRSTGGPLVAVLVQNSSVIPEEVNDFGWFETNATGTVAGTRHQLFSGTGSDHNLVPDRTGKVVFFTPTKYFGYYYSDVSEHVDATATVPRHGCYVYTIFALTEPRCLQEGGQGDHDFVIFSANPTSSHPTFWVTGEDPTDCQAQDDDCNLTIVSVLKL
jgi:hypothetical protein